MVNFYRPVQPFPPLFFNCVDPDPHSEFRWSLDVDPHHWLDYYLAGRGEGLAVAGAEILAHHLVEHRLIHHQLLVASHPTTHSRPFVNTEFSVLSSVHQLYNVAKYHYLAF